jgi:glycosyltransferase involved in cell wall biosynthesis
VGGIPEIYGPLSDTLVEPDNAGALAKTIARTIDQPAATVDIARRLRERVAASFSVESMVDGVLSAYQTSLANLQAAGRR